MHAVDEVDVRETGWAKEHGVARGLADEGMRGWIGEAEVGFDFRDAAGEALAVESAGDELAEEVAGDDVGGTEIEIARDEGWRGDARPARVWEWRRGWREALHACLS